MPYILTVTLTTIAMIPGLAGVLIPVLPGLPIMFGVALVFGIIDHFSHLQPYELAILALLTVISLGIDYASGLLGAKYGGASKRATGYGIIGLIIGLIAFPPFGSIAGLFIGVLVGELTLQSNEKRAIKAASGTLLGTVAGIALNFILAIIFLILFWFFAIK